jgi:hypothetical protein
LQSLEISSKLTCAGVYEGSLHPVTIGAAVEAAGLESDGFLEQGTGDSDFQIVWVIM